MLKLLLCAVMGGTQSVVIREVETDESLEARVRGTLDSQLQDMREDVLKVPPVISENVITTINEISDAIVIRYHQLEKLDVIAKNIQDLLGSDSMPQVTEFLVETATKRVAAMNSTAEMKEIMRWQRRKQVVNVDGQVIGMEAHYRVKLLEEKTKHYISKDSKDTVILIGYKILVHSLQERPEHVLTGPQLKQLKF